MIETCSQCGKKWAVTTPPREMVLCTPCATPPSLPEGEVRRDADGTLAVCLGGHPPLRWKVIGQDPEYVVAHGWRADRHVTGWQVLGNVHNLTPAESGRTT